MPRPSKTGRTRYGVTQLAKDSTYTATHVTRLLNEGKSPAEIKAMGRARRPVKDRTEAVERSYRLKKKNQAEGEETKEEALRRKEIAIANQRELEYAERIAQLVDADVMQRWFGDGIIAARDIILRCPDELAHVLTVEQQQAVRGQMLRALEALQQAWAKVGVKTNADSKEAA